MNDLLDEIESKLEEVEDRLLAEFERIRKTLSGEQHSPIDPGLKNTLDEIVMSLWHDLEHSSAGDELTLRTQQHENISIRIIVLKKLLDAKIPTAFLDEAQEQIENSSPEQSPGEEDVRAEATVARPAGIIETIKRFFRGTPANDASTDITGVEEADEERPGIYLDSVYAAQRLAALASRFQTSGDDRYMMNAAARGKAVFESRELSERMPEVPEKEAADEKTRGPDEIKRKSRFESREPSSTAPGPVNKKKDVAQTPEEIRKKLEARQEDSRSSGKASFGFKDVEPTSVQKTPAPQKESPAEEGSTERPAGKAVFESKDLSSK